MAMPIPGAIRSNAADQFPTSCGGSEILSRAAAKIEVILIFRAQNAFRSASGKSVRSRRESNLAELRHRADRTIGDVRARSSRASPCDEPLCCVTSRRLIPARIRRTPQPVHGEGAPPRAAALRWGTACRRAGVSDWVERSASPESAACGSPPRRAYRPCWRRGRVAEGGGLLNRYRVVKPYRGFESLRLRQ